MKEIEMKVDEIITLINAGYSKEEIEKMEVEVVHTPGEAEAGANVEAPAEASKNETGEEQGEKFSQSVADQIAGFIKDTSAAINKEIERLEKAYQEYNINQANNQVETSKGVDDVIATIINPPYMVDNKKGE